MKLQELGLKTKPATKYFDGGYISFSTENKELFYQVHSVTKQYAGMLSDNHVRNQEHLKQILSIKTIKEAVNL